MPLCDSPSSSIEGRRVGVVGLGHIGGSIVLGLTESGYEVVGYDTDTTSLVLANKLKMRVASDLGNLVELTDVIFVAVPTPRLSEVVNEIAVIVASSPATSTPRIICDVASVKGQVIDELFRCFAQSESVRFVSTHPMAGREGSGLGVADGELVRNKTWLVPFDERTDRQSLLVILELLCSGLGAKVILSSISDHDRLVGLLSHLPHGIAFAYGSLVNRGQGEFYHLVGGGSYRDMTRVAHSSPEAVVEMMIPNSEVLVDLLEAVMSSLGDLRSALVNRDHDSVLSWLASGHLLVPETSSQAHGGEVKADSFEDLVRIRNLQGVGVAISRILHDEDGSTKVLLS